MKKSLLILITAFCTQMSFAQVEPMLKTNWGQGCGYNDLTPSFPNNGYCDHAPVGCSGVALAQIMKYWQHPAQGNGILNYIPDGTSNITPINWDTIQFNWAAIGDTLNQVSKSNLELQKLMYHAAIASCANFGKSATPGVFPNNETISHLGYSYFKRKFERINTSNYDKTIEIVQKELDQKRVVYFQIVRISDNSGHAVVIDGYKNTNPIQFHINCGWNGLDNGYYTLDNLDFPRMGKFKYELINYELIPADKIDVSADTIYHNSYADGHLMYTPLFFKTKTNWTATLNDDWLNRYITSASGTPSPTYDSLWVYPNPNTSVNQRVGSITLSDGVNTKNVVIVQRGTGTTGIDDGMYSVNALTLFPNPATDVLTIKTMYLPSFDRVLNIYNLQGSLVKSFPFTQTEETISLAGFQPGIYFIQGLGKPQKFVVE